jgi:hypothetical protein
MLSCLLFSFHLEPKEEYQRTPDMFGMSYEKVNFKTEDDVKIFGWFFKPSESTDKMIIMSHDGKGNMSNDLRKAGQFISMGYHVLLYDYRGYGKSGEFDINNNFFTYPQFYKDLSAAIEWAHKFHPQLKVDLYGTGIGAGLAIGAGANHEKVQRVIADAPYYTFQKAEQLFKEEGKDNVVMPIGYDKRQMEPKFALEEGGDHLKGILYIVGEEGGPLIIPDLAKELRKQHRSISSIYEVEGVSNEETFNEDRNKYFSRIKEFVEDTE